MLLPNGCSLLATGNRIYISPTASQANNSDSIDKLHTFFVIPPFDIRNRIKTLNGVPQTQRPHRMSGNESSNL